jgi:hypothetical protein
MRTRHPTSPAISLFPNEFPGSRQHPHTVVVIAKRAPSGPLVVHQMRPPTLGPVAADLVLAYARAVAGAAGQVVLDGSDLTPAVSA